MHHLPAIIAPPLDSSEEELNSLYLWVDSIPLSRPKKNIARDFADGVLAAEVVSYYFPKLVDLHNYSTSHSLHKKIYNWNTLNQKVLRKIGFQIHAQDIQDLANSKPMAVERILSLFKDILPRARVLVEEDETPNNHNSSSAVKLGSKISSMERENANRSPSPSRGTKKISLPSPESRSLRGARPVRTSSINDQKKKETSKISAKGVFDDIKHQKIASKNLPDISDHRHRTDVDMEIQGEKHRTVKDLQDIISQLQEKNSKLEELLRIKDDRIEALLKKISILSSSK